MEQEVDLFMPNCTIRFVGVGIELIFSFKAIEQFEKFKQNLTQNEAGGMLFGSFKGNQVIVEEISTPSNGDKRALFSFIWEKKAANRVIKEQYSKGLHYLGDWHTHPEVFPEPSGSDIESIRSTFNSSKHELKFFILFILSNSEVVKSHVVLTDGSKEYKLNAHT
ncbi:Mov34/MPN/PAD-1 family protein [Shewanella hanedai]|uniref:Mov34/MPN/PAD-1 family protein n=1 Tax=Shewanella hanedai TaxID=25 RepID=UPI00163D6A33|nr:Mov34/MPN/PAD-1 family protein [Shewanella hanedai]